MCEDNIFGAMLYSSGEMIIYTGSSKRTRIVGGDYGKETFSRRINPGHRTVEDITTKSKYL